MRPLGELLTQLRGLGVALSVDGEQLKLRAPKGTLTPALTSELQARKAEILQYLRAASDQAVVASDRRIGRAAPGHGVLSFAQQRLWFLDQLEGPSPAYNMPLAARLEGPLDRAALQRALNEIVRRHSVLRTNVVARGDDPSVETHGERTCQVGYHGEWPEGRTERQLMLDESERSFDLRGDPLIRASLYRQSDTRHLLLVTMHHLVSDGWSLGVFCRELAALYDAFATGASPQLAELPIQYGDYAAWQRTHGVAGISRQLDFWRSTLQGAPDVINLPLDHPRPAIQTYRGSSHAFTIDAETTRALRDQCAEGGATVFMGLVGAFAAVLARYSGQDDIVIGTAVANRRPDTEALIGLFVNTLPLRVRLSGDPTVRELIARVRDTCMAAYENQDVPFEQVVEAVRPARDLSHAPVFQVSFDMQEDAAANVRMHDVALVPLEQEAVSSKFDLGLAIEPAPDRLSCTLTFNSDLFEPATIQRLSSHLATLLADFVRRPGTRVSQLRLMDGAEEQATLQTWNRTSRAFPEDKTLPDLVDEQAARTPDRIAITAGRTALTYAQLAARSNQLARWLQHAGVTSETLVAIAVDRSPALVIGLLGILKAGGAYVPLEPSYPKARLAGMLNDARPAIVLTHSAIAADLPESGARVVCLDQIEGELNGLPSMPIDGPGPRTLAYVIYTSGSTGEPKGVQVEHRSLVNVLHAMLQEPGVAAEDAWLAVTTISFDIAAIELYLPLLVGARVVIADRATSMDPQRLATAFVDQRITVMQATPATWRMLVDSGWRPSTPMRALSGGEALPNELATHLIDLGLEVWNVYGPTETTIWSAARRVTRPDRQDGVDPIGPPIDNTQLYVLDGGFTPQPIGVPGELYIGGDGLARGYLHRPDLTAERFPPDPFSTLPGARLYRTGDLVRRMHSGAIEFLGRVDNQVKIRGFRIELGEIEWALARHDDIRQAVVVARNDGGGEPQLVAYVVVGDREPSADELRAFVKLRLPDFMIPTAIVPLAALPQTPNGKIDRRALPAPERHRPELRAVFLAPRTETERGIAEIWQRALGVDSVGVDDNFFDLGGHSLLMTRVHAQLRSRFSTDLALVDLFQYPTVRTLSARLAPPEPVATSRQRQRAAGASRDVAIIGLVGRFPEADDLETFWRNLRSGRESISFFTDEELLAAGVEPELIADPNYVRANGVLSEVATFDAPFFGLSPAEADVMDPQHRVFLESAWHVLEHAGYGGGVGDDAVGVFAACSHDRYLIFNLLPHLYVESPHSIYQVLLGNDRDYLATRASYLLNLKGPSVNVQSACSSSLVAIHLACRSLADGECDMAMAGGVAIKIPQRSGYLYSEGMIVSPDGHCRPFDAGANGTTWGSGIGIVLLKPLERALADRDTIYAVVKGSAINNDGSLKVGFTAPGVDGQARVIAAAHQAAGVDPRSISYVEAHGTGTQMGDPAEVAALTRAFGASDTGAPYCAIGSVKSNIGHLDTAAGIAGLIKTTLALQHREIPPSIHFASPNRDIDFAKTPFFVNDTLREWPAADVPRRAGISSFGLGGTNAHVVLEEAPAQPAAPSSRREQLVVFSARTDEAVDRLQQQWLDFLGAHPDVSLADASYTQATGRARFPHRAAFVATSAVDAAEALRDPSRLARGHAHTAGVDVVFMFPGQGSQRPGMGEALYRDEPVYRAAIDQCADLLKPHLGIDLHDALTLDTQQPLNDTWLTQPALFAVEYAMAQLWMSWGVRPAAMIGHSVGEYVSACLAGVFDLATALDLIAARGRLMWQQPRGAMLAVGASPSDVERRLPVDVSMAAVNGARSCVVAGPDAAIEALSVQFAAADIPTRRLSTSHAFHSAMMDGMLASFTERLTRCRFSRPTLPFISNVTGTWCDPNAVVTPAYWVTHARQAVQFAAGVDELLNDKRRAFLEVGAGDTLTRLVRQHPACDATRIVVSSHAGSAPIADALGRLWVAGTDVEWQGYFAREQRRRIALPLYPFAPERHWVNPPDASAASHTSTAASARQQPLDRWFYLPSWSPSLAPPAAAEHAWSDSRWLVLTNGSLLGNTVIDRLAARGVVCTRVSEADGLASVDLSPFSHILHLWTHEGSSRGYQSIVDLSKRLAQRTNSAAVTITVVAQRLHDVYGNGEVHPDTAMLMGPCLVVPQEQTDITIKTVDLDRDAADTLLAEIANGSGDPHVAYRGHVRFVPRFERVDLPHADRIDALRQGGVYAITGGFGRVGTHLAETLFEACGARLALIGRTAVLSPRLVDLQARGAEILTIAADVADENAMRRAVTQIATHFGSLHGVIHAAGLLNDPSFTCPIDALDAAASAAQFRPKVAGLQVLERVLDGEAVDFCVVISSNAALLGGLGFTAYSAANRYVDAFVARHNRLGGTPWLATNWDTWTFGASASPADLSMTPAESRDAFRRILARNPAGQLIVATGDINARFDQWVRRTGFQRTMTAASIPRAHVRPPSAGDMVPPATASERVLVDLWKELFGFGAIGVQDDFFALGGDSLAGIRLMSMIKDAVGKKLPLNVLLKEPTIRALAAEIDRDADAQPWSPLVPIATKGSKPPFFCVPGTGGSVVYLRDLALALNEHDRPFYGLQSPGLDGRTVPLESIEALAAENVKALLEFQPQGPYYLGGHSFGSWVAIEMAHQLARLGREVAMVAVLDTSAPVERDLSAMAVRNDRQWLEAVADMLSHLSGKQAALELGSLDGLDWPAQVDRFSKALINSGILPADADRQEVRGLASVYRSQAQMRYEPAAGFPRVPVALVRAEVALADFVDGIPDAMKHDPTWGWREYADGDVHLEAVPGDHLTMMTPPQCRAVAAALHRILSSRDTAGAAARTPSQAEET